MKRLVGAILIAFALTSPLHAQTAQNGIALHGDPRYPADFTHFDYVNPTAPKGGDLHLALSAPSTPLIPLPSKASPLTAPQAYSKRLWCARSTSLSRNMAGSRKV